MCVGGGGRSGNHVSPNPPIYNTSNHITSHPRTGLARENKGGGGGPGVESGLGAVPEEEVVACVCVFLIVFSLWERGVCWVGGMGASDGSAAVPCIHTHSHTSHPPNQPNPTPPLKQQPTRTGGVEGAEVDGEVGRIQVAQRLQQPQLARRGALPFVVVVVVCVCVTVG